MRIVLADDHVMVRSGIRSLLEKIEGVEVVGEADDGVQALALLGKLKPDVLLADIAMPRLNGLATAATAAEKYPAVKVIILSMHRNEEYVVQALRSGCAGYLLKDSAAIELDLALEAVARGEIYLSPVISRTVLDSYLSRVEGRRSSGGMLTPRQQEILKLLADGKSVKQIAASLKVSNKTVQTHRTTLMRRLGINDLAGLVKYAIRHGVIPPDA